MGKPFRHIFADGPFAMFHFGNMMALHADFFGKLFLGEFFSVSKSANGAAVV